LYTLIFKFFDSRREVSGANLTLESGYPDW
jgi:hypothetical protein